ncbi:MAG: hypothetical protein Q4G02_02820 [bacterium]|nr:hypothetical protein [bacterium]
MKFIFRPIFIIFFTLLVLSFSFSMRRSGWQTAQVEENLALVQAENRRLQIKEQELTYQAELSALPLTKQRLVHDQKWLKNPDEQNLELAGYQYQERELPLVVEVVSTPNEQWRTVLGLK